MNNTENISVHGSILKAVRNYNHYYIKHISDDGCEKITQVLEILCGEKISDAQSILDAASAILKVYPIVRFDAVQSQDKKSKKDRTFKQLKKDWNELTK